MVGIRAGVVRGMTRGVMGCDYSHTGSYFLLLTHRRCSPCLVIHTGEVLSPFSGIQDWISLSQVQFRRLCMVAARLLWLPPRSSWHRETIQHLAAYYLILTTHTQAWVGERGGGRDKAWGQGNNKGPRAGAWRPSAQKDFRE